VSNTPEDVPDGTFGGHYVPSKASASLPPITAEQAAENRRILEAALKQPKEN
jgi:hypothetical protein